MAVTVPSAKPILTVGRVQSIGIACRALGSGSLETQFAEPGRFTVSLRAHVLLHLLG